VQTQKYFFPFSPFFFSPFPHNFCKGEEREKETRRERERESKEKREKRSKENQILFLLFPFDPKGNR
jgi:hypothetical protein